MKLPLIQKAMERTENPRYRLEPEICALPGIYICGKSYRDNEEAVAQGIAAAGKAAILLNRGLLKTSETIPVVDTGRCRGCGTCASVCPFAAAFLMEKDGGLCTAVINEGLCRGCGICVAHCPSGALGQSVYSDEQISASLESILA
jgi:heterodisulfide reductase subunit A